MAYFAIEPVAIPQLITDTSLKQNWPLGVKIQALDPLHGVGTFIYLKGVASTVVGIPVEYDVNNGTTTLWAGTANSGKPLAIAMSANVLNQFGWYALEGSVPVLVTGAVAIGDKAFFAAGPTFQTAAVASKQVMGAVASSASAAGSAFYQILYPHCQGAIT